MKAVVAAFNQEKALVGAFSVITNLRMQLFEALEGRVRRKSALFKRHAAVSQHILVRPIPQQDQHHDLVVQDIELALI